MSQSLHGTEKPPSEAGDIRLNVILNVIVTSPGDEPRRLYRAKPVVVAEVRFDDGQCIVDAGVGQEGCQALCNLGDAHHSPYVEEVVCVFVLRPVAKGKGLEDGEGTWTAYRNVSGGPCT